MAQRPLTLTLTFPCSCHQACGLVAFCSSKSAGRSSKGVFPQTLQTWWHVAGRCRTNSSAVLRCCWWLEL